MGANWGSVASVSLVSGVSLVSIPQADDWARVSVPAKDYFLNIYIYI